MLIHRVIPLALLLALGLGVAACTTAGYLADKIIPPRVEKVFTLPEKTTLVLVDDRENTLGDTSTLPVIATVAGADLVSVKAIPQVTDPAKTTELAARQGSEFAALPIDQIGRTLGAEQVIYINIVQAGINSVPGILRPTAEVYVKVIDVPTGKLIFPMLGPGAEFEGSAARRGYPLKITMRYKSDQDAQAVLPILRQRMAEFIGRRVGELFYDHAPPDKAKMYDN